MNSKQDIIPSAFPQSWSRYLQNLSVLKVFLLLVLLSAALRAPLLAKYSFWEDEALTVTLTGPRYTLRQIWNYCLEVDRCVFVYNFFLHGWMTLFGQSEMATRLPSLIFGSLTVGFIFLVAMHWMGKSPAAVIGLLAALSPYLIYLSMEARPYALLALQGAVATWALLHHLHYGSQRPVNRWMLLFMLTTLTGIYTNPFYYLFWSGHLVVLAFHYRFQWRLYVSQVIVAVFCIPHLYLLFSALSQATRIPAFSLLTGRKFLGVVFRLPFGFIIPTATAEEIQALFSHPLLFAILALGIVSVGVLLYAGVRCLKAGKILNGSGLLGLLMLFILMVWGLFPIRLSPRQCSLIFIYFLPLFGAGLIAPALSRVHQAAKYITAVILGMALYQLCLSAEHPYARSDWRRAIAVIQSDKALHQVYALRAAPERVLSIQPSLPRERYHGVMALFELYTGETILPIYVESPDAIPPSAVRQEGVWVIASKYDYPDDPRPGLRVIAEAGNTWLIEVSAGARLQLYRFEGMGDAQ